MEDKFYGFFCCGLLGAMKCANEKTKKPVFTVLLRTKLTSRLLRDTGTQCCLYFLYEILKGVLRLCKELQLKESYLVYTKAYIL